MGQAPTYRPATGIRRTHKGLLRACRRLSAVGHGNACLYFTIHADGLEDVTVVKKADDLIVSITANHDFPTAYTFTICALWGV